MKEFSAVVLAAGKGERMKSSLPKVLHKICGRPLVYYVLRQLLDLKGYIKEIVVVVGHKREAVEKEVASQFPAAIKAKIKFIRQPEMLGTADAVKTASQKAKHSNILVVCADSPLITAKTLSSFIAFFLKKKLSCSVLTADVPKGSSLGVISRDASGRIMAIEEKCGLALEGCGCVSEEVNSGIYCFKRAQLLENLVKIKKNQKKGEYFLTDIVEILYKQGISLDTYFAQDSKEVLGINSKKDLYAVQGIIRRRIVEEFIDKGVDIIDPDSTFIQAGCSIGKGTIIYPFTFIEKGVIIGKNCSLGPFIHLRGESRVGDDTQVGNFLEINRTSIGKNVRIKHFGYLGDARIEDNANIGAGTVTANFDGKSKNKTHIKKGAFIGSDTILVAPVKVDNAAVTGAGSVVTKDVKARETVAGVPAKPLKKARKFKKR